MLDIRLWLRWLTLHYIPDYSRTKRRIRTKLKETLMTMSETSLQKASVLAGKLVKKCAVDRLLIARGTHDRFLSLIVKKRVQFIVHGGPFVV